MSNIYGVFAHLENFRRNLKVINSVSLKICILSFGDAKFKYESNINFWQLIAVTITANFMKREF